MLTELWGKSEYTQFAGVIYASIDTWYLELSVISIIESFNCNLLATADLWKCGELYLLGDTMYNIIIYKEVWSAAVGNSGMLQGDD